MSVTLEKRRKVAELENFERLIRQEKRRLLSELESLERPFRKAKSTSWIKEFSSDVAGAWRAYGAASSRAPVWFYVVGALVLLAGGGLVAQVAVRGAPGRGADGATLPQAKTPTTPARIAQPTVVNEAAQAAPDPIAPPPTSDSVDLRERLLEAQSATAPLPEPLPPPTLKADAPAPAPAQEAAPVAALDDTQPKAALDAAPPVDTAESASAAQSAGDSRHEEKPADEGRRAQCLVKVDGRVLFERSCLLRQPTPSTFNLAAGDEAVVLTLERGRTWTASLGGRSLGTVYRTGDCWGRRREVYICAKGP